MRTALAVGMALLAGCEPQVAPGTPADASPDTAVDATIPEVDALVPDGASDAGPSRVTSGLITRWNFDEGAGTTVTDTAGAGAPMNLTISGAVTWLPGALRVDGDTLITTAAAATKIHGAITASGEITVEAWIVPANLTQAGPARIITCSPDTSNRNFQLAQEATQLNGRFRTSTTGINGGDLDGGALATTLTHVALIRHADGSRRLFVNGDLVGVDNPGGDTSTWDPSYRVAIANEASRDRDWLGELHLVAIYGRALSNAELLENYDAGPTAP